MNTAFPCTRTDNIKNIHNYQTMEVAKCYQLSAPPSLRLIFVRDEVSAKSDTSAKGPSPTERERIHVVQCGTLIIIRQWQWQSAINCLHHLACNWYLLEMRWAPRATPVNTSAKGPPSTERERIHVVQYLRADENNRRKELARLHHIWQHNRHTASHTTDTLQLWCSVRPPLASLLDDGTCLLRGWKLFWHWARCIKQVPSF